MTPRCCRWRTPTRDTLVYASLGAANQISLKIRQICIFRANLGNKRGSKGGPKEVLLGSQECREEVVSGSGGVLEGSGLLRASDAPSQGKSRRMNATEEQRICTYGFGRQYLRSELKVARWARRAGPSEHCGLSRSNSAGQLLPFESRTGQEPRRVNATGQADNQDDRVTVVHKCSSLPNGQLVRKWP